MRSTSERLYANFREKARISFCNTPIPHHTGSLIWCNKTGKGVKRHTDLKCDKTVFNDNMIVQEIPRNLRVPTVNEHNIKNKFVGFILPYFKTFTINLQ